MSISLRSLLVVPFLAQIIGITSLVDYLSYRSGQKSVEVLAQQLMASTGERVVYDLDDYLQTAHQINQFHIVALRSGAIMLPSLPRRFSGTLWR